MKKIIVILMAVLMLCSCATKAERTNFVEGIHYPYPMKVIYGEIQTEIAGTISSWDFPGNEEYDSYTIEAGREHPLDLKEIASFSAGAEKTAELIFDESIISYEIRRWKVEKNYLEKEIEGYKLDNQSEKVETENNVFEINQDGGIYVYEVHANYEYGDCYYCFRIDSPDDWGITLSVKNVTATGATVVFTQSGGNPTGELNTGSYYRLESADGELAYIVEGDVAWTSEAYIIPKDGKIEMQVNWQWLYGTLEPGTYKIFKGVSDFRGPGDYDDKVYSAEFTVGEKKPYSVSNMKIVDGAESGNLVLAGESEGVMTLSVGEISVYLDGEPADASALMDGMTAEIRHSGEILETYPATFGNVYEIHVYSIGTKNQVGGTLFDLSGLYLKVLEDLWKVDSGLNGDAEYVSIDLSEAPGDLTKSEKAAIAWIFGNKHGVMALDFTLEELKENGYLTAAGGSNDLYQWDNGVLLSIKAKQSEEPDAYFGLRTIEFDAIKWRSPLGAYMFMDCSASWPQMGTWSDYNIGAEAIS